MSSLSRGISMSSLSGIDQSPDHANSKSTDDAFLRDAADDRSFASRPKLFFSAHWENACAK
jgi:hypothetical protein